MLVLGRLSRHICTTLPVGGCEIFFVPIDVLSTLVDNNLLYSLAPRLYMDDLILWMWAYISFCRLCTYGSAEEGNRQDDVDKPGFYIPSPGGCFPLFGLLFRLFWQSTRSWWALVTIAKTGEIMSTATRTWTCAQIQTSYKEIILTVF